jgi:hypothetical protein
MSRAHVEAGRSTRSAVALTVRIPPAFPAPAAATLRRPAHPGRGAQGSSLQWLTMPLPVERRLPRWDTRSLKLLGEILDAGIEITAADMGNIQLLDDAGRLGIVAAAHRLCVARRQLDFSGPFQHQQHPPTNHAAQGAVGLLLPFLRSTDSMSTRMRICGTT